MEAFATISRQPSGRRVEDGKAYGFPLWFYGYVNYLNTKQFKEVGLDPEKDAPQTWDPAWRSREAAHHQGRQPLRAPGLQVRDARRAVDDDPVQSDPVRGGAWFDANGKCTVNNAAGVKAMTIRASIARQYGAEDPADSIATNPLPQMDWLKERCSMFLSLRCRRC